MRRSSGSWAAGERAPGDADPLGDVLEKLYPGHDLDEKLDQTATTSTLKLKTRKTPEPTTDSLETSPTAALAQSPAKNPVRKLVVHRRPKPAMPPPEPGAPSNSPTPTVTLDRLTSATRSARRDAHSTLTMAASSVKGLDLDQPLTIPARSEAAGTTASIPTVSLPPVSFEAKVGGAPAGRLGTVPVNRAEAHEIMEKLNIDARRARMMVEFRKMYGRFLRPEDLEQVTGITDEMVNRWEEQGLLEFD